jgi:hypothetical protein
LHNRWQPAVRQRNNRFQSATGRLQVGQDLMAANLKLKETLNDSDQPRMHTNGHQ